MKDMRSVPHQYYSIYFTDPDVNNKEDIIILSHDNNMSLDRETINKAPNHFTRKADAYTAKTRIWMAMNKIQQKKY